MYRALNTEPLQRIRLKSVILTYTLAIKSDKQKRLNCINLSFILCYDMRHTNFKLDLLIAN